jgi:hypothetical protein
MTMSMMCNLGFHQPVPSRLWNDGHYFSQCERCGVSMIRKPNDGWEVVPANLKVVWRERTEDDVVWPTHVL